LRKIDRTTVRELSEITGYFSDIQTEIDRADRGLNPLGLAKDVVPFDLSPNFMTTGSVIEGKTHFEQVLERTITAMQSAFTTFSVANEATEKLRDLQQSVDDFRQEVKEQERDFNNRLIESFGYPYPDDIGSGRTYPTGYDGPDLYHFDYVEPSYLYGRDPNKIPTKQLTLKVQQPGTANQEATPHESSFND